MMASDYYDMMRPGVEQFAYLKCPSKVRAALINAGGQRLSVQTIERMLKSYERLDPKAHIGDPTKNDGIDFRVAGLVKLPKPDPQQITEDERQRIAKLAAKLPNKKPVQKRKKLPRKVVLDSYVSTGFAENLIEYVCEALEITPELFLSAGRKKRIVGARSLVIKVLRDRNPAMYSYPRIARIVGRRDHSTIIYAYENFEHYAAMFPILRQVYADICGGVE